MIDYKKQGKKNRQQGLVFEKKVREDLESKDWIVDKWTNIVKDNKLIRAKVKWIKTKQGLRPMGLGSGFPDFIAFKRIKLLNQSWNTELISVESKINGKLDKKEKEQLKFYIEKEVFDKILIAYKEKQGRKVIVKYKEYKL